MVKVSAPARCPAIEAGVEVKTSSCWYPRHKVRQEREHADGPNWIERVPECQAPAAPEAGLVAQSATAGFPAPYIAPSELINPLVCGEAAQLIVLLAGDRDGFGRLILLARPRGLQAFRHRSQHLDLNLVPNVVETPAGPPTKTFPALAAAGGGRFAATGPDCPVLRADETCMGLNSLPVQVLQKGAKALICGHRGRLEHCQVPSLARFQDLSCRLCLHVPRHDLQIFLVSNLTSFGKRHLKIGSRNLEVPEVKLRRPLA